MRVVRTPTSGAKAEGLSVCRFAIGAPNTKKEKRHETANQQTFHNHGVGGPRGGPRHLPTLHHAQGPRGAGHLHHRRHARSAARGCPEPERHRSGSASEPCVRVSNSHGSSTTWRLSYAPLLDDQFLWPSCCRGSDDEVVAGCEVLMFLRACAGSRDPLPTHLLHGTAG